MIDFLKTHQESMPHWLINFDKNSNFNVNLFSDSRVVFYAGSGFDGSAVKTFGATHFAHCFLYTDDKLTNEQITAELDSAQGKFRGYNTLSRMNVAKEQLTPYGWTPHVTPDEIPKNPFSRTQKTAYAFVEILEREKQLGPEWGPERICILFIAGDAVATYDAIFCQDNRKPPMVAVLQDHGFGGNYTSFGKGGLLELLAKRTIKLPMYLWITKNSTPEWSGYTEVQGTKPLLGGEFSTPRHLFKINEYTYEDLSNITGVEIRQIRYFVAEQLIPAPTGNTRGTRFNENQLLLLTLIKAKLDQGHSTVSIKKSINQLRGWGSTAAELSTSQKRLTLKQINEWEITDGIKLTIDPIASSLSDEVVETMLSTLAEIAHGSRPKTSIVSQSTQSLITLGHKKISSRDEQIEKIKEHHIERKLHELRNQLVKSLGTKVGEFGQPDVSRTPQDPHFLIKDFHDSCVDLQVKMQLTGQSVVINLLPQGSSQRDRNAYTEALTRIQSPYTIRTGNMYGRYAQTHNFKEKSEGFRHGVPIESLETIIRLILETKQRLEQRSSLHTSPRTY